MPKETALRKAIKATRMNSEVPRAEATALLGDMANTKAFGKLAEHVREGKATLKAKRRIIANRPNKYICVCYADRQVPVTKAKLYSKARTRKCKHCGKTDCHRPKSIATMRKEVAEQIYHFKLSNKLELTKLYAEQDKTPRTLARIHSLTHCAISDTPLANSQVHIDHITPFADLLDDWLVATSRDSDWFCHNKAWLKRYESARRGWYEYHLEHARLQQVSAKANLKKGRKRIN